MEKKLNFVNVQTTFYLLLKCPRMWLSIISFLFTLYWRVSKAKTFLWSCKYTTFSSSREFNNLLVPSHVPYTLLRPASLRGQTRANGPVELLSTWGEIIDRKVKYFLFNLLSMRSRLSIIESYAKTKSIHILNTLLAWKLSIWSYCYIVENNSQRMIIYERLKKIRNLLKRSTK